MNYNRLFARRNPELLRLKVARMAENPFAFFRGTFHLYARDVLDNVWGAVSVVLGSGAEVDLVGDIHSENYGTYKAADETIHYDINDFDETTRGHFDFDICRLATSLFLVARDQGNSLDKALLAALTCVAAYVEKLRQYLKKGENHGIAISGACPAGFPTVEDLVKEAAKQKRADFIDRLTEGPNHRQLRRSLHYFTLPDSEREQALRLLEDYRGRMPPPPTEHFYKVQDVCGRVAGIGSMGRLRYVVLVNGKGNKESRNVLLEFKEARPSAYDVYRQRETDGPVLRQRAERVITVQRQSQIASSSYLGFAVDGGMSFQVREIGPHDSRLDIKMLKNTDRLEEVTRLQAGILARAHARAFGRVVGLANPLAGLENTDSYCQRVLSFVLAYADLVQRDWKRFIGNRADLEKCESWAGQV
jgi:uncharacterized protein (DUF2252 family)